MTKLLDVRDPSPQIRHAALARAGRALREGRLVAFPTETVYGLGADAHNGTAVAAIFAAKGRPTFNPLIVHVAEPDHAHDMAVPDDTLSALMEAFWPGPLTLVADLAAKHRIAPLATAGLPTVALRCPDHEIARALIAEAGCPVVAPSANRSGHVSPTTAEHVREDLAGAVDIILDGGPTAIGVESTIVAKRDNGVVVLREGGVTRDQLAAVVGRARLLDVDEERDVCQSEHQHGDGNEPASDLGTSVRPIAPGQLASHYAPNARVLLNCETIGDADVLLAFGQMYDSGGNVDNRPVLNLSPTASLAEAAANLFAYLRELDSKDVASIAVMPIPEEGLGRAINDRLRRAAAPRD